MINLSHREKEFVFGGVGYSAQRIVSSESENETDTCSCQDRGWITSQYVIDYTAGMISGGFLASSICRALEVKEKKIQAFIISAGIIVVGGIKLGVDLIKSM